MRLEIEMTDAHLLLVDSDSHSRDTLVGYFQSETGITFHTACNPQEAWAVLQDRAEQFDLMILDCLMPERGSLDLLQDQGRPAPGRNPDRPADADATHRRADARRHRGREFAWRNYLELDPHRACDPNGRGIAPARMLSFSSIHYED